MCKVSELAAFFLQYPGVVKRDTPSNHWNIRGLQTWDPGSPPQVIELQMGNACGVLDVQLLAAKVRSEDSKLKRLGSGGNFGGHFSTGTKTGGKMGGLTFFLGGTGVFER